MKIFKKLWFIAMVSFILADDYQANDVEFHPFLNITPTCEDHILGLLVVCPDCILDTTLVSYIYANFATLGPEYTFGDNFHINPCLIFVGYEALPYVTGRYDITENASLSVAPFFGINLSYNILSF